MNLLQIVQTACNELGLIAPAVVATATDPQTLQFFSLANREGGELLKVHEWTFLQKQFLLNIPTPLQLNGATTNGSAVITSISPNTTGLSSSFVCTGNNIPVAARVVSVDSSSQVTLDSLATSTNAGVPLIFAKDTYSTPSDFDRYQDNTMWDRTNRWPLLGPSSPQEDQWHRSGVVTVGPRRHYRQVGQAPNNERFWPPPGTGDTPTEFAQEYVSNGWVNSTGAGVTFTSRFAADTDVPLFDPDVMILGIKWRFFQTKQFDYVPMQAEYRDRVDTLIAHDGPKGTLNMARRRFNPLITPATVQDGFFPGPSGP